ncbi:hypothetical protein ACWJJH_08890 [Endozoicomonadaceae bacterium StTr2]
MHTIARTIHPSALFAVNKDEPKRPSALKRFGLRLVAILKGAGNGYCKGVKKTMELMTGKDRTRDLLRNLESRPVVNSLKLARKAVMFYPAGFPAAYVTGPVGAIYGACKTAVTGEVYSRK